MQFWICHVYGIPRVLKGSVLIIMVQGYIVPSLQPHNYLDALKLDGYWAYLYTMNQNLWVK